MLIMSTLGAKGNPAGIIEHFLLYFYDRKHINVAVL